MKVQNLSAKRFFINCGTTRFSLLPASGVVELPDGADKAYLKALESRGSVKIVEDLDDIEDAEIVDPIDALRDQYKELSGEDANARWGEPKLTKEIALLQGE